MSGGDGERILLERLRAEGRTSLPWSNGPGDEYRAHRHDFDKVLVVARLDPVRVARQRSLHLGLGDRLELRGTSHDALVGHDGVTCLEAHAPVGTLRELARRVAGDW